MLSVTPVILCGGSGTRLWPLSRSTFPKQFLSLIGNKSLFQQAILRVKGAGKGDYAFNSELVITSEQHRFLALEQLREIDCSSAHILLEPVGRNTAPALTLAAHAATLTADDPILVVTPSDHLVDDLESFSASMRGAIDEAVHGGIVMLGVKPNAPETGYGYIRFNNLETKKINWNTSSSDLFGLIKALKVDTFFEKPNLSEAQQFIDQGNYLWNAGIFVLRASTWLKAIKNFRPDIASATKLAWDKRTNEKTSFISFTRPGINEFQLVPSDSIDYAVIEKCPGSKFPIKVVPLFADWSDLGAWEKVWEVLPKDKHQNACVGDVLTKQSVNTLVHATSRLVSLIGVKDLVVIETPDVVMVANKGQGQEVKEIVQELEKLNREEHNLHRKVHRPWGWYDSIDESEGFKVKRICVKPGAAISLQRHRYRAEHWIVVRGTAEVLCGANMLTLSENQSTYIPRGEIHRLKNPLDVELEIIEVQSGSYLGEDDIERFDDDYGRSKS